MAEVFGAIQRGLGEALSWLFSATHSYVIAIILLTIAVRALLIPLTVKQIKSMTAMQKLAPEQKKIQQKYKGMQQKAKDRAEVQALRLQMNQELQGLYKASGVNPLGGCLPLVAQMPVFIALYSVFRAAIVVVPMSVTVLPGATALTDLPHGGRGDAAVICRPVDTAGNVVTPTADGPTPSKIDCVDAKGKNYGTYGIGSFLEGKKSPGVKVDSAPWINFCAPTGVKERPFTCISPTGTGHLPRDSKLFRDVTADKATILGMHAGCSATQIKAKLRTCTTSKSSNGGGSAIPYYILVAFIVFTSYYQSKQMSARAPQGPQQQQQQMMTRLMPVMFGFISLQIPAGANIYFLATNAWTIGQQHILLKRQDPSAPATKVVDADQPDAKALPGPKTPPAARKRNNKKRKR
jgi:YidC/Oxa1 family membrane protein insertase